MLEVAGLEAGYGSIRALHGVDIAVPTGGIVALLGANGAGKTTLMRTIAGLMRPTSGTISFDGVALAGRPAHRVFAQGVSLVAQGRQLFPEMTVIENLEQGGLVKLPKRLIAERVEEILDLFPRLRERAKQRAAGLSGGEQQMLATGRALMSRPRLLLLDEPTTGLAPIIVDELIRICTRLKEAGQTILLVEQNVRMALTLSDTVYILRVGEIVHRCPTEELRQNHEVLDAYFG